MKQFTLIILALLTWGCSTPKKQGAEIGPRYDSRSYASLFSRNTRSDERYDGFHQLYVAHVTQMNSEIQTAILQKQSDVYQWNSEMAQAEREKLFQESSNSSKYIVTLFTPNHKANDLHKDKSMWRVYLDVNGERYDATIKRRKGTLEDIQAIYPSHNRFTEVYEVIFNVPMTATESSAAAVTLTSALGTSKFKF